MTKEQLGLNEARTKKNAWKKWGPCTLSIPPTKARLLSPAHRTLPQWPLIRRASTVAFLLSFPRSSQRPACPPLPLVH